MPERPLEDNCESERLFGALTSLLVQYPTLISHLTRTDLTLDITFYVEDLAMECAQSLLDVGITAVHRLVRPRVVSIQLPSLLIQHKAGEAIQTLDAFLQRVNPTETDMSSDSLE